MLLWGFVDGWQHMFLLWVHASKYLKRGCQSFHHRGRVWVDLHALRFTEFVYLSVCVLERVYICICVYLCVCATEWTLSGAAPCCASCIWSHLCCSSVGVERMTLMYLNPRQTFPRQLSVWNQDNWAQSSWTSWSGWWAEDRCFGYTVTSGQTHWGVLGNQMHANTKICLF